MKKVNAKKLQLNKIKVSSLSSVNKSNLQGGGFAGNIEPDCTGPIPDNTTENCIVFQTTACPNTRNCPWPPYNTFLCGQSIGSIC
jgi:hypothetical protein